MMQSGTHPYSCPVLMPSPGPSMTLLLNLFLSLTQMFLSLLLCVEHPRLSEAIQTLCVCVCVCVAK